MDALREKGHISDPATKAKSIRLSAQGLKLSKEFREAFLRKVEVKPGAAGCGPKRCAKASTNQPRSFALYWSYE